VTTTDVEENSNCGDIDVVEAQQALAYQW